jgi:hypothetical protein
MRTSRSIALTDVTRRTGLSSDEVKRFNPALVRQVPASANLYLPSYVEAFGPDVAFWHRPADPSYAQVLNEFLRVESGFELWHEASFEATLDDFKDRFERTDTEEGDVMATMLAYVISDLRTSRRAAILEEFRTSGEVLTLFRRGVEELGATLRGL